MGRGQDTEGFRIDRAVETGEHHPALVEPGDGDKQIGGGGNGAGRSGGDHRVHGWAMDPGFDFEFDQAVAPFDRVETAFFRQNGGPVLGQDAEEI